MTSKVIIVAPADDAHAIAVQTRINSLSQGTGQAVIVDLATYPLGGDLSVRIEPGRTCSSLGLVAALPSMYGPDAAQRLRQLDVTRIARENIRAVWWRRARLPLPHPYEEASLREFAQNNTQAQLWGYFLSLSETVPFVNVPMAEAAANYKLVQLEKAIQNGLDIPPTLITNNPLEAATFVREREQADRTCVVKQLRPAQSAGYLTQPISSADAPRFAQIQDAPVILQERVHGLDVRVVVVGEVVFAASEEARVATGIPDIRATFDTSCAPLALPENVRLKLLTLHRQLGLSFGAYDFIRSHDGRWIFLEVNTSGQWLYVETGAAHRISEALARLLWCGHVSEEDLEGDPFRESELDSMMAPFQNGVLERARASSPVKTHWMAR